MFTPILEPCISTPTITSGTSPSATSPWPVCLLAGTYDQILAAARELTAHLSAAEQAAVFGGSAAHWYRISS